MKRNIVLLMFVSCLIISGCEDLIDPAPRNFKDITQMYTDPAYAQGFLVHAYRTIPGYYDNSDYATDDAVTNDRGHAFLQMATGSWTASWNPVNRWTDAYGAIQNINIFLENVDKVHWADDEAAAELFRRRMKGEAFGLRALFHYYLLRSHSGFSDDGQLLGVPILTEFIDTQADFNLPRNSFEDCVRQVYADLDSAEFYLPLEYEDLANENDIPEELSSITTSVDIYNRVMGNYGRQLFNGLIAKSFRTRLSLMAASPAYNVNNSLDKWAKAANDAADVLNRVNGISGLDPNGGTFYANYSEIYALGDGVNPNEIIWRENLQTNNLAQEEQHFPPSLFGNGRLNPTQNIVDAFPMANGFPITDERSGYESSDPYTGRDQRFSNYIIYDGSIAGNLNAQIFTGTQSSPDGIRVRETGTRTGYYMKKRLNMQVNLDPVSRTGQNRYTPRIRYTEIFLAYAEAANEAWGPTLDGGGNGYSAYDVIKAIRSRAGITGVEGVDIWLEESAQSKEAMRLLIKNERRLELSFESFRFWDLRRWKNDLTEAAKGLDVSENNTVFTVEPRDFNNDYMHYGPIPHSEILKYNNLQQNRGWN